MRMDISSCNIGGRKQLVIRSAIPLLDIYGRSRGCRDRGRVCVTRGIADGGIAIRRRVSGRPVAIIAETVTQQSYSKREAIRAITASMTVLVPVMVMPMVAVTTAGPSLSRRERSQQHERHAHQFDCSHFCLHSRYGYGFPRYGRAALYAIRRLW
jgi:hypothetical protein